jgi:hypothetical protein
MGELLLSIGTFRRICGKKKDGQRGATTTQVEVQERCGRVSSRAYQRERKDIPGDKVLCNTWRASILSSQSNAKKMEDVG